MPQGHPRPRHAAWAVLTALLLAASCGGDDAPESRPRPTTTAPTTAGTTTPTTLSVEAEVEAAYDAYNVMFERLTAAPDPDDPELADRLTGEALGDLTDRLSTLRATDQALRLGPDYSATLLDVRVAVNEAVVTECVVDDADLVDGSGNVVTAGETATVQNTVTMTRTDGAWRISEARQTNEWRGIAGCAS